MSQKNKIRFYFLALSAFFGFLALTSFDRATAAPVISDINVTLSTSSVQVAWTATDSVNITNTRLDYGLDTNYFQTSTLRAFPGNVSGTKYYFATKLVGLSAGSKVFYRIKVDNSDGESSLHADSFVVPYPDTVAPVISSVTVAAQTTNATISWDTNELATCRVVYSRNDSSKLVKDLTTAMKEHYVYIGDLLSTTNYNYQIICKDESGNSGESPIKIFTTAGLTEPPKNVSRFQASYLGSGVNLTWVNPSEASFDRVKVVRLASAAAVTPSDGESVYEGKAQKFYDSKVVYGRKYYYTIFSLDNKNQASSGATAIVGGGVVEIPESTVSISEKLSLSDFRFYSNKDEKALALKSGVLFGGPGDALSVSLPVSALAFPPESIQLMLGSSILSQFSLPTSAGVYQVDFSLPSPGEYRSYILISYANGKKDVVTFNVVTELSAAPIESKPPKNSVSDEKKPEGAIANTVGAIAGLTSDEQVQEKVNTVVAPTLVGVTAVSAISILSWVNILPFLQLLIQPLSFVGRKKRFSTGLVYNSLNKMPVDLATVRLLNRETGQVVQSKVTDNQGRYAFTVNPGLYKLQVFKNGFVFPTQILKDFKDDGKKFDIYHGQTIESNMGNNLIAFNIPLDPAGDFDLPIFKLWGQKLFKSIQAYLVWAGLIIIIISLYISPRWYTAALLPVQVLVLVMTQRLSQKPRIKSWGVITDAASQRPVAQAIVRLFNAELNKFIGSQVTDSRGRYYFIAGEDKYYLTVEHQNYETKKTKVLDLTERKTQTISVDIALTAKRAS